MDNKYMIQMAESRGLFGDDSTSSGKGKSAKSPRKTLEENSVRKSSRKNKRTIEVSIFYKLCCFLAVPNRHFRPKFNQTIISLSSYPLSY